MVTGIWSFSAKAGEYVSFYMRAFTWVTENPDAPNLCPNPGFEPTAGDAAPQGIDWVATNAPPGWSKWSIDRKPERLTWEREGGRTEPGCARIAGARNACFIGSVPVKPGELVDLLRIQLGQVEANLPFTEDFEDSLIFLIPSANHSDVAGRFRVEEPRFVFRVESIDIP